MTHQTEGFLLGDSPFDSSIGGPPFGGSSFDGSSIADGDRDGGDGVREEIAAGFDAYRRTSAVGTALLESCTDVPDPRPDPGCPVEVTLAALRGRWTPLVLREFLAQATPTDGGPARDLGYAELAAALPGISDKVLGERLTQLCESGVLARTRIPGWPPRVRYALTDHGWELAPILDAMWHWGQRDRQAS